MIPKAERDADAAILAAATGGTWITAALPTRAASPEIRLGSFGPCVDSPRNMPVMVCIQAPGATFGDVAMAEATTSWEQHAANAKAAVHCRNRLPAYIAALDEMERRIARIEAWHKASTDSEHGDPDERAEETLATVLKILRGDK